LTAVVVTNSFTPKNGQRRLAQRAPARRISCGAAPRFHASLRRDAQRQFERNVPFTGNQAFQTTHASTARPVDLTRSFAGAGAQRWLNHGATAT